MFSTTPVKLNGRKASTFYHEVINGLWAENKYLSSKYFYDQEGDEAFPTDYGLSLNIILPVAKWRSSSTNRIVWCISSANMTTPSI